MRGPCCPLCLGALAARVQRQRRVSRAAGDAHPGHDRHCAESDGKGGVRVLLRAAQGDKLQMMLAWLRSLAPTPPRPPAPSFRSRDVRRLTQRSRTRLARDGRAALVPPVRRVASVGAELLSRE